MLLKGKHGGDIHENPYLSFYRDKKRVAWLVWALIKNNQTKKEMFYFSTFFEYCTCYFFIMMIGIEFNYEFHHSHEANLSDSNPEAEGHDDKFKGLSRVFLEAGAFEYYRDLQRNYGFLLMTSLIICVFYFLIILLSFFLVIYFDSPREAAKPNLIAKFLSVLIIIQCKFLFTLEVWIVASAIKYNLDNAASYLLGLLSGANLLMMLAVDFFLFKLFNIRVKNKMIVWAQVNNIQYYALVVLKCFIAASHVIPSVSTKIIISCILVICTQTVVIYILPIYDYRFQRFKLYLQQVLMVMNVCYFLFISLQVHNYILEVAIIFSAVSYFLIQFGLWFRTRNLLKKFYGGEMKFESDVERFLLLYIGYLEQYEDPDCQRHLLSLLWFHKSRCTNIKDCYCQNMFRRIEAAEEEQAATEEGDLLLEEEGEDDVLPDSKFIIETMDYSNLAHLRGASRANGSEVERRHMVGIGPADIDVSALSPSRRGMTEGGNFDTMVHIRPAADNPTVEETIRGSRSYTTQALSREGRRLEDGAIIQHESLNQIFSFKFREAPKSASQIIRSNMPSHILYDKIMRSADARRETPIQNLELLLLEKGLLESKYHQQAYQIILLILYDIIKEYDQKFEFKKQKLISIRAHFELEHLNNKFLCHSTITRLSELKLGIMNYLMMQIDNQYLLERAHDKYSQQYHNASSYSGGEIDVSSIIEQNLELDKFYKINEEISLAATNFWTRLNFDAQDLETTYKDGIKVAQKISEIQDRFASLSQSQPKNYMVYYQYAVFQKYVLNKDQACDAYLQKMEQLREIKQVMKNKYRADSLKTESDDSGFIMVKATFKEFGHIIFSNKTAADYLGYDKDFLMTKTINIMMPNIISENHHRFWKKFIEFGTPTFIDREQHLFVKNSEGFIIPILVYVKFHHDHNFGHTFIAILNKPRFLTPFSSQKKYLPEELMVLMTDDKENIIEINETASQVLGLSSQFVEQNSKYIQDALKVNQVFDIRKVNRMGQVFKGKGSQPNRITSETNCTLHENFLAQLMNDHAKKYQKKTTQVLTTISDFNLDVHRTHSEEMQIKMLGQNYKQGLLMVKFYFIGFNTSKLDDIRAELENKQEGDDQFNSDSEKQESADVQSVDSQIETTAIDVKDIQVLIDKQNTPRILKIILQLVMLCFIIMTSISVTNMIKFIQAEGDAEKQILITTTILDRLLFTSKALDLMQCYQEINQQRSNQSKYQPVLNMFAYSNVSQLSDLIKQSIINSVNQIKAKQIFIDASYSSFNSNPLISSFQREPIIPVWSITQNGISSSQNQTVTTAFNIFIQTAQTLATTNYSPSYQNRGVIFGSFEDQFLNISKRYSQQPNLYPQELLSTEQALYAFMKTGYQELMPQNYRQASAFKNETLTQFSSYQELAITLLLISVCSIFVIFLAVIPQFSRIQNRKYKVLTFFFQLAPLDIKICLDRSMTFEDQFYVQLDEEVDDLRKQRFITKFKDFLVETSVNSNRFVRASKQFPQGKAKATSSHIHLQLASEFAIDNRSPSEDSGEQDGILQHIREKRTKPKPSLNQNNRRKSTLMEMGYSFKSQDLENSLGLLKIHSKILKFPKPIHKSSRQLSAHSNLDGSQQFNGLLNNMNSGSENIASQGTLSQQQTSQAPSQQNSLLVQPRKSNLVYNARAQFKMAAIKVENMDSNHSSEKKQPMPAPVSLPQKIAQKKVLFSTQVQIKTEEGKIHTVAKAATIDDSESNVNLQPMKVVDRVIHSELFKQQPSIEVANLDKGKVSDHDHNLDKQEVSKSEDEDSEVDAKISQNLGNKALEEKKALKDQKHATNFSGQIKSKFYQVAQQAVDQERGRKVQMKSSHVLDQEQEEMDIPFQEDDDDDESQQDVSEDESSSSQAEQHEDDRQYKKDRSRHSLNVHPNRKSKELYKQVTVKLEKRQLSSDSDIESMSSSAPSDYPEREEGQTLKVADTLSPAKFMKPEESLNQIRKQSFLKQRRATIMKKNQIVLSSKGGGGASNGDFFDVPVVKNGKGTESGSNSRVGSGRMTNSNNWIGFDKRGGASQAFPRDTVTFNDANGMDEEFGFEESYQPDDSIPPQQTELESSNAQLNKQFEILNLEGNLDDIDFLDPEDEAVVEQRIRIQESIKRISKEGTIRRLMIILLLSLLFSSYFIGIYILSTQTFNSIYEAVQDLDIIYRKNTCLVNAFLHYRMEAITNSTKDDQQTRELLAECSNYEYEYVRIKREQRAYFSEVMPIIDELDSSQFCQAVYSYKQPTDAPFTVSTCLQIYNSIFSKGLTYSRQQIIKSLNFQSLMFHSLGNSKKTPSKLLEYFEDPDLLLFIFTKEFILDVSTSKLVQTGYESIVGYLNIIFTAYIASFSLMCFCLVVAQILFYFVLYRKLRQIMADCNSLLKILPFSQLDSDTHESLKKFILS